MEKEKYRAVSYIRLSKEDGDSIESESVGNQRGMIRDFINRSAELELCKEYVDDGYTGLNLERPMMQKLLADVEKKKIDCIIVKDFSRLSRDDIDANFLLKRKFVNEDIRFISISENFDSKHDDPGSIEVSVKIMFNNVYSRDISKKVHGAFRTKRQAGEFIGAFAKYGYQKDPANKNHLIVDEYPASIIKRIFQMYVEGYGQKAIVTILNGEGILSPSAYKEQCGFHYRNCNQIKDMQLWQIATIRRILADEMYIGNMVQGKSKRVVRSKTRIVPKEEWIRVENTHEAIIDKELWKQVQRQLELHTRDLDLKANVSIFAGLLKCGDCKRAMAKKNNGKSGYFYQCGTYVRNGTKYCTSHYINHQVLCEIVLNDLNTIITNVTDIKRIIDEQIQKNGAGSQLHLLQHSLSGQKELLVRNQKEQAGHYRDFIRGIIPSETIFQQVVADSQKEQMLIEQKIKMYQFQISEAIAKEGETAYSPWIERLIKIGQIQELDRSILVDMIEQMQIFQYEDGTKEVKIMYRFSPDFEKLLAQESRLRV